MILEVSQRSKLDIQHLFLRGILTTDATLGCLESTVLTTALVRDVGQYIETRNTRHNRLR